MENVYKIQSDGCRICPYNRSHVIKSIRFVYHLMKCSKSSGKTFEICPFNAQHHVVAPNDVEEHMIVCESRSHAETERVALSVGEPMTVIRRELHVQYEDSARMRIIEAQLRERQPVEGAEAALPSWMQEALMPCEDGRDDASNMAGENADGNVNGVAADRGVAERNNDKKVEFEKPAYAIEAEMRLIEEYNQEYEAQEQQRPIIPRGRARILGIQPYYQINIPQPRPVPHQYMLDFEKYSRKERKKQYEDAPQAEPAASQPTSSRAEPAGSQPTPPDTKPTARQFTAPEAQPTVSEPPATQAEPAVHQPTIAVSVKLEESDDSTSDDSFHSTLDFKKNISDHNEDLGNRVKVKRELLELQEVFDSMSLSNLPNVAEAFHLLLETVEVEAKRQEQK